MTARRPKAPVERAYLAAALRRLRRLRDRARTAQNDGCAVWVDTAVHLVSREVRMAQIADPDVPHPPRRLTFPASMARGVR